MKERLLKRTTGFPDKKLKLELQLVSSDKIITEERTQDLEDYKSQSLLTQAKKSEQLLKTFAANGNEYNTMQEEILEISRL